MQMACNNLNFIFAYCSNGLYDDLFNMEIIIMECEFTVSVTVDETGRDKACTSTVLLGHFPLFTRL